MNLSMTTLEDAWGGKAGINNRKVHEKIVETGVDAFNMKGDYDEFIINVDSFKPHRIDLTIKNKGVVDQMKTMSPEAQQQLATELLMDYFTANPTKYGVVENVVLNEPTPPKMMEMEMNHPTPESTTVSMYNPFESNHIEYMRHQNSPDKSFLCLLLLFTLWMLVDRVFNIIQHA